MKEYLTIKEVSEKWNLSERWIQTLCARGDIIGAVKFGHVWAIPMDTPKAIDKRVTTGKYKDWRKKNKKERN